MAAPQEQLRQALDEDRAAAVRLGPQAEKFANLKSALEHQEAADPSARGESEARAVEGLWDALAAGYQTTPTGLLYRGEQPDVILTENSTKVERLVSMVGQLAGDAPTTFIGGALGAGAGSLTGTPAGTLVGAGAGSLGLTEGARTWLMEQYAEGAERKDLAERLAATAFATAKGATLGGLTAGAGGKVKTLVQSPVARTTNLSLPGAPVHQVYTPRIQSAIGQQAAITTAEAATLVGVSSALEMELPKPADFYDAAAMIGGLRIGTTLGRSAGLAAVRGLQARRVKGGPPISEDVVSAARRDPGLEAQAAKLQKIYERTGVPPKQVVKDAQQDSRLWQQLLDDEFQAIPDKYRTQEQSPLRPGTGESMLDGLAPEAEAALLNPMKWELAKQREPYHINPKLFDLPEGPVKLADSLATTLKEEMKAAQRGPVPVSQTMNEAIGWLRQNLGEEGLKTIYEPGTADWAAELTARKLVTQNLLKDLSDQAITAARKGEAATAAERADVLIALDRVARAQKAYTGRKAEAGRAMRILQEKLDDPVIRANEREITDALKKFGGPEAVDTLTSLMADVGDPATLMRLAAKPTMFEKFTFAWKAGMLSAPQTMQVTTLGNIAFAAYRVPEKMLAAGIGALRRDKDRVAASDTIGYTLGHFAGAWDALLQAGNLARSNIKSEGFAKGLLASWREVPLSRKLDLIGPDQAELLRESAARIAESEGLRPKTQKFRRRVDSIISETAIPKMFPGLLDDLARAPFNVASLGDMFSSAMTERATIWESAMRQARVEGHEMFSPKWKARVAELSRNPSDKTLANATKVAKRTAFQETGKMTDVLNTVVKTFPITEPFVLPFRTAATAVPREVLRRTLAAPAIKSWREDFKAGGAQRDQAIAEVFGGLAVGLVGFMLARDGVITGSGHPDRKQRRADYNAGFQPYSIKDADGNLHQIARWEPVGSMLGLSADAATAWDLMTEGERGDALLAMLWAGREVFLNKTWLRGVADLVGAIQDPLRYGDGWMEGVVGPVVPNAVASWAAALDPYVRDVNSVLDAVQNRIPYLRENLPPVRDGFGQPVEQSDREWPGAPMRVRKLSDDPVRLEAARLGAAMPSWPRTLHAGSVMGEGARVDLAPEERDMFASEAGQTAYEIMSEMISEPNWARLPDLAKRRMFERVFTVSRKKAAITALPPEKRKDAVRALMVEEGLMLQ